MEAYTKMMFAAWMIVLSSSSTLILVSSSSAAPAAAAAESSSASGKHDKYVRDACGVTRYPDVCIQSLSPFSDTAKHSPGTWARAGVSVTLTEAKRVVQYLKKLKQQSVMRGRNRAAIVDCLECFQDAVDSLHESLGVLRRLSTGSFDAQMGDVITWLSSALTDEDTCLEGFQSQKGKKVIIKAMHSRVIKVSYITSNALALVNRLATTGPESPSPP